MVERGAPLEHGGVEGVGDMVSIVDRCHCN